jgi:two-component system NarL family sensor kinase
MDLQQLQQRNQELAILNQIAQDLNRETELQEALNATIRQTVHLLNLQTGWIWLVNSENKAVYLAAEYNLPPIFSEKPELLTGTCYCIDKYLIGSLENAANISEITCTRLKDLTEGTEGLRYHASIPLMVREEKIGIMNVLSTNSQELSDNKLQLLYTIGDMLSIAIERARLFENSRQIGIIQERNRLAREMHDTLAQGLSGIALKLETIQVFLEQNELSKVAQLVDQSLNLTRCNLEEARRSVLDLRATPLQDHNLVEAIEKLVSGLSGPDLTGIFTLHGSYQKQSMRTELGLYRIVQEATQNIVKHAEASQFEISLSYVNELQLIIQDNGKGFEAKGDSEGFGLVGIQERVRLLHGQFNLDSQIGKGTTLTIDIPKEVQSITDPNQQ